MSSLVMYGNHRNAASHSKRLRLVPYLPQHVPKYHDWMEDEWLRDMTASVRLSIEEEYQAQQEWVTDPQKCTFLVFDKAESLNAPSTRTTGMCGDVNLFLMDNDASEQYNNSLSSDEASFNESSSSSFSTPVSPKAAEIMVMIADANYRRKGYAYEAVINMMYYGYTVLGITRFVAKITETNYPSLILFGGIELINQLMKEYGLTFPEAVPRIATKNEIKGDDGTVTTTNDTAAARSRTFDDIRNRSTEVSSVVSTSNSRCLGYRFGRYMKHFNEVHLVYDIIIPSRSSAPPTGTTAAATEGTLGTDTTKRNRGENNDAHLLSIRNTDTCSSTVVTLLTDGVASDVWKRYEIEIIPLSV